jgi:hypothetical protein
MKKMNLSSFVTLFFISLSTLFVTSCSKGSDSDSGGDYYIRAKVNDQTFEYKETAVSNKTTQTLTGTAFKDPQVGFPFFSFDIESLNSPITTGTFRENNTAYIMIFRYGLSGNELYHSQMGDEEDFQFIVETLNGDVAEGRFQGTIRNAYNFNQLINVTEGRFRLRIVQ